MPVYTITDNKTGKTLDVRGDRPPTQEEAQALFDAQPPDRPAQPQKYYGRAAGYQNAMTSVTNALPMLGGMLGGALGTATGIPTLGLGSVPGAIVGAGVLGGGGEAAKQLINRARGLDAPQTSAGAATDIGKQAALQSGLETGGQIIMPALAKAGQAVYRGYLKPSLSRVNLPKAAQITKDAIDEGIPITAGGSQKARELIGALNNQVDDILKQQQGRTVDLNEVADSVREWAKRMYDRPGRDPRDLKAVLSVADRIDGYPPTPPMAPGQIGLPAANQVKRDIQGSVRDKFGVPGGTAETAGEKFASAQMRQAIEAQAPAVGPLNARQSRLLDVAKAIDRATAREANQSMTHGVKTILSAGAGGGAYLMRGGNPVTAAVTGLATRMALTPAVASRAAIVAAQLGEKLPGTAAADVARVAVQAVLEAEQQGQDNPQ